jgi:transposase-like protein
VSRNRWQEFQDRALHPDLMRKTDHATRLRMAEMYRGGASIQAVATEFEVSFGTARRCLLDTGVELRRPGRAS